MKNGYVYILTNKRNGTLYVGVTSNLARRIHEHKTGLFSGFSKQHNLKQLIYMEEYDEISNAIWREKCIKRWKRAWKIRLIEEQNPEWIDLSSSFL